MTGWAESVTKKPKVSSVSWNSHGKVTRIGREVGKVSESGRREQQSGTKTKQRVFLFGSYLPDSLGVLQRAGGARAWLEDDTHVLAVPLHTLHL